MDSESADRMRRLFSAGETENDVGQNLLFGWLGSAFLGSNASCDTFGVQVGPSCLAAASKWLAFAAEPAVGSR